MTEVLHPPNPSSSTSLQQDPPCPMSSPTESTPRTRPPPRDHYAPPPQQQAHQQGHQQSQIPQPRISSASSRASRSRPHSASAPVFVSSLPYASVRDFAYPGYNPMHYGAPPDPPSDPTTPGSEWNSSSFAGSSVASSLGRRVSDPNREWGRKGSAMTTTGGEWSAGAWTLDDLDSEHTAAEGETHAQSQTIEPLPSTSFGHESGSGSGSGEEAALSRKQLPAQKQRQSTKKHRKSKSYTDISLYERGRRRRDSGRRRSSRRRADDGEDADSKQDDREDDDDGELFALTDPAGRAGLRHSRGTPAYMPAVTALAASEAHNGPRRDSHIAAVVATNPSATLPTRSFHPPPAILSTSPGPLPVLDPDDAMPLDAEPRTSPHTSPHRQSIGPEDEDLFAGPSLALYSFEPENANELRLKEMQVIMVSYRHGQGWLVAEDMETGEQGLVPEEYVRLLEDIPGYDAGSGTFVGGEENDGEDGEHDDEEEVAEHGEAKPSEEAEPGAVMKPALQFKHDGHDGEDTEAAEEAE